MKPLEYLGDGHMLFQMVDQWRLFPASVGGQVCVDINGQDLLYRIVDVHEDLLILGPL